MSEFIKVTKDGEVIEIHPLALEDHKRLGWKVVGEEDAKVVSAETAKAPEPETEAKPKRGTRRRVGEAKPKKAEKTESELGEGE